MDQDGQNSLRMRIKQSSSKFPFIPEDIRLGKTSQLKFKYWSLVIT